MSTALTITSDGELLPLRLALEHAGPRACLSHLTAARLLGIEVVDDPGTQHVTVPRNRSRCRMEGWAVVRSDVEPADRVEEDGLRATGAVRTVADLARTQPTEIALASADSAVRLGLCEAEELRRRLTSTLGQGAAGVRAVGHLLDPLSGSVLESLLRHLLVTAGLPYPRTQYRIADADGDEIARVDFCWPERRLVVEADGFAFHSDRAAYRRDRTRANQLTRLGWRVLRFSWEDVRSRPDYVVGLVRACLATSVAA